MECDYLQLEIMRLRVENIRDFVGEVVIDFTNHKGKTHHISLIQMPNGTGKTTTRDLIAYTIWGKALSEDEVRALRPSHKFYPNVNKGLFELFLLINEKPHILRLSLQYDTGEHEYSTSKTDKVGGGYDHGHLLPVDVQGILTESFTNLFIFDGELSSRLLSKQHTRAEQAIHTLYFLDRLEAIKKEVDEIIRAEREKSISKTKTNKGIQKLSTQLKNYTDRLIQLNQDLDNHRTIFESNKLRIESKREEYRKIMTSSEGVRSKYLELATKRDDVETRIVNNSVSLLAKLEHPSNISRKLHDELAMLGTKMTELRLPKTISYEFFQELAESEECICGEKMTSARSEKVRENSKRYLSEDKIVILNQIKHAVKRMPDYETNDQLIDETARLNADLITIRNQLELLEGSSVNSSEQEVGKLAEEITTLDHENDNIDFCIRVLTEKDTNFQKDHSLRWDMNIPLCNRQIEDHKKRIQEAAQTKEFEDKAEELTRIIDEIINRSIVVIKQNVIRNSNNRITTLLGHSEVEIGGIDRCIEIKEKSGVSQGQSLSVAYAFLSTLFEDSAHRVPFVVDSPAGALDNEVRYEAACLIPDMFKQFVALILPSERPFFVNGLQKSYDDIQYITIHKVPNPERDGARLVTMTESPEFFDQFQPLVEEE